MDRTCDTCGLPMTPQTGRGGRRKRHPECGRRRNAGSRANTAAQAGERLPDSTLAAVNAEIARLGAQGTPEALLALNLAARIDGGSEPGAALGKEFRAVLADLRRAAPPAAGLFDQLAAKRAENERAARRA